MVAADPEETPGRRLIKPGGKVDAAVIRELAELSQGDEGLPQVRFCLTRDLAKRLDKYLTDRIGFMSRSQLQELIEQGEVTVNGRAAKASTKLRLGDVVEVTIPPPPSRDILGENIPLDILYEDAHMLVLNKQPDIIVHPARNHHTGTLLNALVYHFAHHSGSGGGLSEVGSEFARPGVVHRLDRDTSGVMVVAKTDEAHWRLARQFERREPDKRYLALVEGVVETAADVIDVPLGPSPSKVKGQREKQTVRHDHLGKHAVTIYRVRQRLAGHTLVELELKTGRTHQIRLHMAFLGYPIVADDMYGGHALRDGNAVVLARQALHAARLSVRHPISNEPLTFHAPLRQDMAQAIRLLRERDGGGPLLHPAGAIVEIAEPN